MQEDTRREDWPHVTADQQQRYLASSLELLPASGGRSDLRGRLERPLLVLLAATALVLLLACLNVANLFLARGFARRRETALCLALGASRSRVVRDLLIQCGLVAVGGGVLGVAMAPLVTHALLSFLPTGVAGGRSSPDDQRAGVRLRARRRGASRRCSSVWRRRSGPRAPSPRSS